MKQFSIAAYIVIIMLFITSVCLLGQNRRLQSALANKQVDTVYVQCIADTLSDWELFTLALMKVESDFKKSAVSPCGAKGYFQIMPIYVKEVNRIHGTNYQFDEVVDSFEQSYEVFDLMQQAHNPDYDMKKALELHNGKHDWYNRRVFNEYKKFEEFKEMEGKVIAMRDKCTDPENQI